MSGGAPQRRRPGRQSARSSASASIETPRSDGSLQRHGIVALALVLLGFFAWHFHSRAPNSSPGGTFSEDVFYNDILKAASQALSFGGKRVLNGTVLAYVTPWNGKGYDMAKKYREKFTHISPVWYQLKLIGKDMSLTGKHDVDQGWMADVRKNGSPLIVPRVVLEGWSLENMLVNSEQRQKAIKLIVDECNEQSYDGAVLEAWNSWASYRILDNNQLREKALAFVRELATALHKVKSRSSGRSLQLILVVPPERGGGSEEFKRADLDSLKQTVDGFSLMTYDFSNAYQPGPNAPLSWVRSCLRSLLRDRSKELASKILMGINFYGNDYILPRGGGAILGSQFLDLLEEQRPKLVWDSINEEHFFDYSKDHKKHRVYFPTGKSIFLRLKESVSMGTGVSIWEIGQGLDHFFELL